MTQMPRTTKHRKTRQAADFLLGKIVSFFETELRIPDLNEHEKAVLEEAESGYRTEEKYSESVREAADAIKTPDSVTRQTKFERVRKAAYLILGKLAEEIGRPNTLDTTPDEELIIEEAKKDYHNEPGWSYEEVIKEAGLIIENESFYCPVCRKRLRKTRGRGGGWLCAEHGYVLGRDGIPRNRENEQK